MLSLWFRLLSEHRSLFRALKENAVVFVGVDIVRILFVTLLYHMRYQTFVVVLVADHTMKPDGLSHDEAGLPRTHTVCVRLALDGARTKHKVVDSFLSKLVGQFPVVMLEQVVGVKIGV